ncbi:SOS response-associated peptidase [Rothia terrae]|uniref:Abasic site processing protein n=1 Tax=Rothia terrae TaxID=396015 RepID=A0A7H2BAW8_9MICC|nr:SOS response-associated peptidase [Rothia terrae]QNV36814.1 SOS response-associated peptidase [Rothia terrae]
MCGRYAVEFDHDIYLAEVPVTEPIASYNVAPTQNVPVLVDRLLTAEQAETGVLSPQASVLTDDAGNSFIRELHSARWGLLPGWAKESSFSSRAFNARSETVFSKPTFRKAAVSGHCAVPVSGYFEWKTETTDSGKTKKTPFFIHRADADPIYFAGLYDWWKIPETEDFAEARFENQAGQWLLSCSIITMASPDELDVAEATGHQESAHALMDLGNLHDRLPVPLTYSANSEKNTVDAWLRSGGISGLESQTPLIGYSAEGQSLSQSAQTALAGIIENAYAEASNWRMHAVSSQVGNVANNFPALIEPDDDLLSFAH